MSPRTLAVLALPTTGALAGLCLPFALIVNGPGGEDDGLPWAIALLGPLVCVALLALAWVPIARRSTGGRAWPAAAGGALHLVMLLPVCTLFLLLGPARGRIECDDDARPTCGTGFLVGVPAVVTVPWTLAGLLPLQVLLTSERRASRVSRSRSTARS